MYHVSCVRRCVSVDSPLADIKDNTAGLGTLSDPDSKSLTTFRLQKRHAFLQMLTRRRRTKVLQVWNDMTVLQAQSSGCAALHRM
ncbi:hypothetical protein Q8A67_017839 [Cirrhinus molitorella]|uniref:Uncharacterized protein n=1 Tax=Cirrhinus molitorella TaxID=172907 RepID=A0AA88PBT7_9TELE|nr:hypothetical protein Q8A67_017839 [Cirrhinus molitorella]